ncbi:MAG TPA: Gfo/Idh/MocA family oxidoreductase [Thermomicrobiales bacterium]|jgi:predicted dehydrogenase
MRFIQAGVGSFGKSWAELVRDAEGTTLEAIVEPAAAGQAWAIDVFGMPAERCFATIDEALETVGCEAVLVVTPPATHLAVATAALRAGKHVLMEKPLAPTMGEARQAVAEADAAGRVLMVSQNYRFQPLVRAIQAAIAHGEIGDLVSVHVECRRDLTRSYEAENFRYGMLHPYVIDMSIHHWDLLRALTGREVRTIDARSWRVPGNPYRHDPSVAALVTLDGGVPVLYEGSVATHRPWTSWNGEWEFIGERGRLFLSGGSGPNDPEDVILQCWGEEPRSLERPVPAKVGREASLDAFRTAVLSGEEPETSARDNINSLACVLACVASIEQGGPVAL